MKSENWREATIERAQNEFPKVEITLEMLRDFIYEAFSAEKRANEANIQSIRFGMDMTPERSARWQKANINHLYRMEQLRIALSKYHNQINNKNGTD